MSCDGIETEGSIYYPVNNDNNNNKRDITVRNTKDSQLLGSNTNRVVLIK